MKRSRIRIRKRPGLAVLLFAAVAAVAWLLLTHKTGMYQAPAVFCSGVLGWWVARPFVRGRL
ncbi:hypothetical protein [Actinomadura sp. WAC 06369]|uniref:hypothetical protein n=1 Tax=Actinomadura sp. WAC 06369 TaxID=2203193 RepID=UPI000F789659|nr:hypothetical protein [Actinomadura sp. WAC 06369]RSN53314.1 hypothetical protein DMH08_27675 [Actinomadura sp. WAC 06369]